MKKSTTLLMAIVAALSTFGQNVGVGTTTPHTKLEVTGAISSTPVSAAAAAVVTIPNNVSIFRLTPVAGTQTNALTMATAQEGQYLTIYNEDNDAATFAAQTIVATSGVMTFQYINAGWRLVSDNQAGANNFVKNQTASVQTAGYNISGNGYIGGNVGIGTTTPACQLSNTNSNIIGTDGGISSTSIAWASNSAGYTQALYNANTSSNADGLSVKIAGTAATNRIMELTTGATQSGAASSVMAVMGNGNVGIGTNTPGMPLTVRTAAATANANVTSLANAISDPLFQLNTTKGATTNSSLDVMTQLGQGYNGAAPTEAIRFHRGIGSTDGAISITTSSAEHMRITSAGDVGIGTTDISSIYPANAARLYIYAPQQTTNLSAAALKLEQYYVDMGSSNLYGPSMMFNTNNNTANSTWNCGVISGVIGTPGVTGNYPGGLAFSTKAADGTSTGVPTERMRITHTGNVGIGTNAPAYPLQIGAITTAYTQDAKVAMGTSNGSGNTRMWSVGTHYGGATTTSPNYGFFIRDESGSVDRLNIDWATGNVGIGTNVPSYKLDVAGDINTNSGFRISGTAASGSYLRGNGGAFVSSFIQPNDIPSGSNNYIQNLGSGTQSANFSINGNGSANGLYGSSYLSSGGNIYAMGYAQFFGNTYMESSAYVAYNLGIGTAASVPLDVANGAYASTSSITFTNLRGYNYTNSGYQYFAVDGNQNTGYSNSAGTFTTSIRAQYAILTSEVMVTSDARIKYIEGRSDAQKDLASLCQIKVTNYQMRDRLHYGCTRFKKVIAQELEQVYPIAVNSSHLPTVIPNLYAKPMTYKLKGKELIATMTQAPDTNVKVGSRCRYYVEDQAGIEKQMMGTISKVEGTTLCIVSDSLMDEHKVASIFLYGVEINDLLSVDYDAISMLNVSATQELAKQLKDAQSLITKLQADNEKMNTQNGHLQNDVDKLKASVETLQQIMGAGAQK